MEKKLPWFWLAALAFSIAYFLFTYSDLPDRVATHFDAAGTPNGFQTKGGYLNFFLVFTLLMNGIFTLMYFTLDKIPVSMMNIPRKDYWLSNPGRQGLLTQKLRSVPALIATFMNCVFIFTEHVVYQANVPNAAFQVPITGGVFFVLLGGLFLAVFIFILLRPPQENLT